MAAMQLIDGKLIANEVHAETRAAVDALKAKGTMPGLAVVLVGDDPASRAYVRSKDKMSKELGLHSVKHELPAETSQSALMPPWSRRSTRARTWTDSTRSTSPNLPWAIPPASSRAHRSVASGCCWRAGSIPRGRTRSSWAGR
jgi:hypothetical protein